MGDYRPRVRKTAETWTKLFILANGRMPTESEIPFSEFEDMDVETEERKRMVAKLYELFAARE